MRTSISAILAGAAGVWIIASPAAAQSFNVSCVKGGDERTIEILTPGEVGATCDVRYTRGGVLRTPYHANNSQSFCTEKAGEIVSALITSGFACGRDGGPLTAEARPAGDDAVSPVDTAAVNAAPVEPLPEPLPAPASASEPVSEPVPEPVPEPVLAPAPQTIAEADTRNQPETSPAAAPTLQAPSTPAPAPAQTAATAPVEAAEPETLAPDSLLGAAPIEEPFASVGVSEPQALPSGVLEPLEPVTTEELFSEQATSPVEASTNDFNEESDLLNEPAVETVATRGPASLAGNSLEDLQPAAQPIVAGRLVGVTPDVEPAPPTHAGQNLTGQVQRPATTATPVVTAVAPVEPRRTSPTVRATGLRDPEEIIAATLQAQAAAWNEGNLAAFMDIYWNDDDLKFMSGTSITKGWSATMKRYRDRYADGAGLGQLSFEKTDVEMITDDVAVVTGRFTHVKNQEASSGAFTLVMKRVGGVWRIVHDHSVGDLPRNQ